MHSAPKALFRDSIRALVPKLNKVIAEFNRPYRVWKRVSNGWESSVVEKPDSFRAILSMQEEIEKTAGPFMAELIRRHSDYGGQVGFPGNRQTLRGGSQNILHSAMRWVWYKHHSFDIAPSDIDELVNEFEGFVDKPNVRFTVRTTLLNCDSETDHIEVPNQFSIRRMSEDEVSELHGGDIYSPPSSAPLTPGIQEFCLEAEVELEKQFGELLPPKDDPAKTLFDKAVLCLRTFQDGPVGYDLIQYVPHSFCPIGVFSQGCGDLYVPFGAFSLSRDRAELFVDHSLRMLGTSESSMLTACARLADASTRKAANDKIVDAVIGMETLLLSALGSEDRRGELKFRFSLNYSTLFDAPLERRAAYRLAKDLYDLRSAIAHGSTPSSEDIRLGDERLSLSSAARKATDTLRRLIQHLQKEGDASYKRHEYWEFGYFGLRDTLCSEGRVG